MKVEKHGYRFTNKQNSIGGIISTIISITAVAFLVIGLIIAYKNKGNAGISVGIAGTMAFILSTIGLVLALKSFKEKDRFYVFSWIGTIANGIIWAFMCFITTIGMMA